MRPRTFFTRGLLAACLGASLLVACGDDSGAADASTSRDASSSRDASATPDAASPDASPPPGPDEWTPPLGIPEPEFGIRELAPDAPDPWTVDTPGFYYVDNTHAAATDDGNPYGTPDKPRLSIPEALEAGDVVQVRGGSYVGDLSFRGTGSADAPIFISGPAGGEVVIDGHVDLEGSYLLLERLTLEGDDAGLRVRTPSDHIAVRFCEVRNAVGRGSGLYTGRWNPEDDPATATQIVFYGNSLHDLGNWRIATDEDHHCASLGHHADHVWFVDNQMSRCSGDGVQVNAKKAYLAGTLHHVYIGRNQAWENKQTGFWTKQATDVVMSQNRVWGMRPSGSSGGAGLGFQYGPERVWFLANEVFDCEMGVTSSTNTGDEDGVPGTGEDVYILGNLFHDIHKSDGSGASRDPWQFGSAIHLTDQTATKHVIGNTVVDVDVGITYARGTGPLVIQNNLLAGVDGAQILIETSEAAGASSVDYCLFEPAAAIRWGTSMATDVAAFQTAFPGQCAGCVEAAPGFVDAAMGDFQLTAASAAVDAGETADVYATFEALYGISIAEDFNRAPRERGAAPDIGAFER